VTELNQRANEIAFNCEACAVLVEGAPLIQYGQQEIAKVLRDAVDMIRELQQRVSGREPA
jgi:hypothetical protein